MSVAKRISGDKALIYLDYKNKENKESEVPGSRIVIQSANCYCGSSFLPEGTGVGALLGTSTSKLKPPWSCTGCRSIKTTFSFIA